MGLKPFRDLAAQWRTQAALCDHDAGECWRPGQEEGRRVNQAKAVAYRDFAERLERAIVAAEQKPARRTVPSKSKSQHNLMQAAAHNPAFAKKAGVPQSVAKEFTTADKAAGKYQGAKKGPRKSK